MRKDGQHMETLSDLDLINSIKNKNKVNECLQELIDRHSGIYLDIVNSFLRNCNNDSLRYEIIMIKNTQFIIQFLSTMRIAELNFPRFSVMKLNGYV